MVVWCFSGSVFRWGGCLVRSERKKYEIKMRWIAKGAREKRGGVGGGTKRLKDQGTKGGKVECAEVEK